VDAAPGQPLRSTWTLRDGRAVTVCSAEDLGEARGAPLSEEQLREQFSRLGASPYGLEELAAHIEGRPFAPVSLLNQLRRSAVEALQAKQGETPVRAIRDPERCLAQALDAAAPSPAANGEPELHLLLRGPEQIEAALALEPASITLDYLDLYGLKPSVERVRDSGVTIRVASPRIWKPGEERVLEFLLRLDCPLLVRPAGMLRALRGRGEREITGDFSLNAANLLSARLLLEMGLSRITPTHDLNAEQVAQLARDTGPERIEAVAYQHLPVFHTEHCVFCRFLSSGTSYKDCGRPCESHRVSLEDVHGRRHPLLADVGCRNTVFGAEAQEASLHLERWREAGIRHLRLEFVHETGEEIVRITRAFRSALAGAASYRELHETLRRTAPGGTTQGSLFIAPGYTQLPVLQ
jgi:putative protease